MSGYLHRLAERALHPTPAIRPIVGSIYAPPKHGGEAGGFAEVEEAIARVHRDAPAAGKGAEAEPAQGRETSSPLGPAPIRTREAEPLPRPEAPRPIEEVIANYQPLVREVRSMVREPAASKPDEGRNSERAKPSSPVAAATVRESHRELGAISADDPRRTATPSSLVRTTAPLRRQTRAPVAQTAAPPREPDQIEIHIGRIEVTAVPPQPPAPAVKQPRKAMSLDEYLKRGNRRVSS